MFLPFLTALSAEFGRVEEKAKNHPKTIKRGKFQDRKSKEKTAEKGGSIPSRIKAGHTLRAAQPKNTATATLCGISVLVPKYGFS